MRRRLILFSFIILLGIGAVTAREVTDTVKIHFKSSESELDPTYMGNRKTLVHAKRLLESLQKSGNIRSLKKVEVIGAASPEGESFSNEDLSVLRAHTIFDYLSRFADIPESIVSTEFLYRDWDGIRQLVEKDPQVPYRKDVLELLDEIIDYVYIEDAFPKGYDLDAENLTRLKELRGGEPYYYIYQKIFPEHRASELVLTFEEGEKEVQAPQPPKGGAAVAEGQDSSSQFPESTKALKDLKDVEVLKHSDSSESSDNIFFSESVTETISFSENSFKGKGGSLPWEIRTNLLYDLATTPNLSLEVGLRKHLSLSATLGVNPFVFPDNDGSNPKLRHWLVMPELKWWKSEVLNRSFWGVHALYSQYNIGGLPLGSGLKDYRYDGWAVGVGGSWGWHWNFTKKWGMDASVGVGYVYMRYDRYLCGSCGKKAGSFARNYVGPTKAEVSLTYRL